MVAGSLCQPLIHFSQRQTTQRSTQAILTPLSAVPGVVGGRGWGLVLPAGYAWLGPDISSPHLPDCSMNVHHKCQKKVANLCGINQKLLAEALNQVSQVGRHGALVGGWRD